MASDHRDILDAVAGLIADFESPDWRTLAAENNSLVETLEILERLHRLSRDHREAARNTGRGRETVLRAAPKLTTPDLPFAWGGLEVRERLGWGGMGEVFRAFDHKLARDVALKLAPAESEDERELLAEARRLARVRHPNVLTVHGADVHDGMVGLWTDLLGGQTLEEKLAREGPLSPAEAALLGIDLCRALRAVHDSALVHGDVKATNVMREDDGTIVLLDFGAGRVLGRADVPSQVRGTPLAMSPEVLNGDDPSPASDLYALGVLLYRLTSGSYPVRAETLPELLERHRAGGPTPLRDHRAEIAPVFAAVVDRALAPEPALRYESADAFEGALAGFLESTGVARAAEHARAAQHNLPSGTSRFIGRSSELAQLKQLVQARRLVTLTGAGGSGKTRLAQQVASSLLSGFVEEIRWVELAPIARADGVLQAIAVACGLRQTSQQPWREIVLDHFGAHRALLVLDNCDHLLPGCADVIEDLLAAAAELTILTTSRERLALPGEMVFPVRPLPLPAELSPTTPRGRGDAERLEELRRSDAVALFLERAQASGVAAPFDRQSAPIIAQICRRLDGMPLAIELAAARARTLALPQILARLDDRLAFLVGGSRGIPRHRTLEATIDWSHELLEPSERAVFRRLAVFAAGCTLETAEAVVSGDGVEAGDVLDLLGRLVDKSLVECDTSGETARYRMLETVKEYAHDRLEASGEREQLEARHRDYFIAAVDAAAHYDGKEKRSPWVRRLGPETEDLRLAHERCLDDEFDLRIGLRYSCDLGRLWFGSGHWSEARALGRRMLARTDGRTPTSTELFDLTAHTAYLELQLRGLTEAHRLLDASYRMAVELGDRSRRAVVHGFLGNLAFAEERYAEAQRQQEESLAINLELGDERRAGICHSNLGNIAELLNDPVKARAEHEASLALGRKFGDRRSAAYCLGRLGDTDLLEEKWDDAIAHLEESLRMRREMGDRWGIAACLSGLSVARHQLGERGLAFELADESESLLREIGDVSSLIRVLSRDGELALQDGDHERARSRLEECLRGALQIGSRFDLCSSFMLLGKLAFDMGDPVRAARLLGASGRVWADQAAKGSGQNRDFLDRERARCTVVLGPDVAESHFAEGFALGDEEAGRLALGG